MSEHGTFHWNELMTRDVEGAKAFYGATIGWSFDGMPMADGMYWVAKSGDRPVAGLMDMSGIAPPEAPPNWFAYLAVDDVDARVALLEQKGGTVLRPPFDVPGVGRIAIVRDPQGVAMGWMTPAG